MLDQNYSNSHLKGTEIAEKLHGMGFTRLYLLSGENLSAIHLPQYLTGIQKMDVGGLENALND